MSAKRQSLGKGFDLLMPKDLDASILEEDRHRIQKILITDIVPNPDQPRREFGQSALDELAESIKRHGVVQPIIVIRVGSGYKIVAGERRWRAATAAKLTHMPAIVRSLKELEAVELSLIENMQREDLSPLEQALSIYKLQQQFNLSYEEIAKRLGKAQSTVSNIARLLHLPDAAKQALTEGKISEGHARSILALKGNKLKQNELLESILNNRWTVRQAEQFVLATKRGKGDGKASGYTVAETALTKDLSKQLGAPVKIKRMAHGGQLIISFGSDNELKTLTKRLQK